MSLFNQSGKRLCIIFIKLILFLLLCGSFVSSGGSKKAFGLTLNVVDAKTGESINAFRWLVNLDNTNKIDPANPNANLNSSLSVTIAKSYSPVLASGDSRDLSPLVNLSTNNRYVISVVARDHKMSSGYVDRGQNSVTVRLVPYPLPLAQILVQVFHDNHPINAAPDVPTEEPLEGFKVVLYDQGGQVMLDYWGNMLGTTYLRDANGQYILDAEGNVQVEMPGMGLWSDAEGFCYIRNIAPGKYGVRVVPPTGAPWIQTSTIEGTRTVDAWVQENEPPFFDEFGFLTAHAWYGFVLPQDFPVVPDPPLPPGQSTGSASGTVRFQHTLRPPLGGEGQFGTAGPAVSNAYLGINNLSNLDEQVYVGQGNEDGTFLIENIPPGQYQLVVWDKPLDVIIAFRTFTIPPEGGAVALGDVLVPDWFGHIEGSVFYDENGNGMRDAGEMGLMGQGVNLRFKDGTIYQATATDQMGNYSFDEVFPWFHWIVAEVDFLRYWPTGVYTEADGGGDNPPLDMYGDTDPTLTLATAVYADQYNRIDWGKRPYDPNENGGIAGIVYYSVTRAENDPAYGAAEPWEPGIPRVTVNLYRVTGRDAGGNPIIGPRYRSTITDSWNHSNPSGCPGDDPDYVDCSETLRTWNQVRPGVFDGGYAFGSLVGDPIPPGEYVVEVVPPDGYEVVKEEDKNVDFGNEYGANPLRLPPPCVGEPHVVPDVLSFDLRTEAPYAGQTRRLCTRKLVILENGQNTACDFFLFTLVPVPGKLVGLVTDDLVIEPNPNNPRFSDKLGPSFVPISVQDYMGNEIVRTYTDAYGQFEVLLPSTIDINIPSPTGVAPNMVKVVTNHPGTPQNPDPFYDPDYKQLSLNFDIWPGKTTYADIAIISQSAFPGATAAACSLPSGTPVISMVTSPLGGPVVTPNSRRIQIRSKGTVNEGGVTKDYGFGILRGSGSVTLDGEPLPIINWGADTIVARVPSGMHTGQLIVTRGNGRNTVTGITLHVGEPGIYEPPVLRVGPRETYKTIWDAIEAAPEGALVLIQPGEYHENLIMHKKVKLQGYGAESTIINGGFFSTFNQINQTGGNQAKWVDKYNFLIDNNLVDLVPGARPNLALEQGAGITVLVKDGAYTAKNHAQIDGLTIIGAQKGGGIFVNGYARYLEISNCNIRQNSGNFGGGIRVGTPSIFVDIDGVDYFSSSFNDNINIHHNRILENGGFDGGGGVSLFNGATNYVIEDCQICGNNTLLYGGGIEHYGLSDGGVIQRNSIIFNGAFDEGGGILIAGELPAVNGPGALTAGSGSVVINQNLIQGNLANDDGGGIRLLTVNGLDVTDSPADPLGWHTVSIYNNLIVNNVTSDAGGGIALGDAVAVDISNNTIARNDSSATGVDAFTTGSPVSQPLGAGIADTVLSATLSNAMDPSVRKTYTDPILFNNIIHHNNSYHWNGARLVADPAFPQRDLQVYGGTGSELLNPNYCLLTAAYAGGANNVVGSPAFSSEYNNTLSAFALTGEGTFITLHMEPLSLTGNYHITGSSNALNAGFAVPDAPAYLLIDFDGQVRPNGAVDIGADEFYP